MGDLSVSISNTVPGSGDETFGSLGADIAEEFGLHMDPQKVAFCKRRLRDAIDDLNRKKLWRFNLIQAADVTTTPGSATISVPADLWRLYSTRKSDATDYRLDGIQQDTMDVLFQSQSAITGYPYIAANFNIFRDGTLRLFPTPDGAYTITLRYFRLIAKPASDDDYLDLPRPYQQVPVYGAKAKVAALTQQATLMAFWSREFQQAYADMNRSDEESGDENLRFINIEELGQTGFVNPSVRPRMLDFY